ncbi:MAG: hypothetical protein E6R04_03375 [Spirochaetes bacterium]|nr:MAG: hypothetical protein E6R04_03375 [Spirochaetota bacterium]
MSSIANFRKQTKRVDRNYAASVSAFLGKFPLQGYTVYGVGNGVQVSVSKGHDAARVFNILSKGGYVFTSPQRGRDGETALITHKVTWAEPAKAKAKTTPSVETSYWIDNPFSRGDTARIPAGTVVRTTRSARPRYVLSKAQTVQIAHANKGHINRHESRLTAGTVLLPEIVWAGTGGYWCRVQVTPELAALNGKALPQLPPRDARLDVDPDYATAPRWTD